MNRLLIAGATGLVGGHTLRLALEDPRWGAVIAPTRRPLAAAPRLENRVIDFTTLPPDLFAGVSAVACALGTTRKAAGSRERFLAIDRDLVIAFASGARRAGVTRFAYVSSVGAHLKSATLYLRSKAETEAALTELGFESLTLIRPSFLGGSRAESRPLERVGLGAAQVLSWAIPTRYRIVPASAVARTMLDALATGAPGTQIIPSEAITR